MPPRLKKRWQVAAPITAQAEKALEIYPATMRQILFNRGLNSAEKAGAYLAASLPVGTDPFGMIGMEAAVERLALAIQRQEAVAVYGDYDVDGVTATALLVQVLRALGASVREYIPNRFDEGYGLNNEALDGLAAEGIGVVVTVDCGIRSLAEAEHARELGLDLIISDHHQPLDDLPAALAVINPKQAGDAYADKDLAGVGLAYKIAQALARQVDGAGLQVESWLDLVALGTVADLAPLTGENRALVRAGLERIRHPQRQGLLSLALASGLDLQKINAMDIGFVLGPRLNAAGRLKSALAAFGLLMTENVREAGDLAQKLDNQNRERQQLTRDIQARAEELALANNPDALLIFAADASFNPGVVGLAASRLTDTYYRPAIVAAQMGEFTRGSCRSIPEFHITEALDRCQDLLVRHGGHAAAAGFTVHNSKLPELVERLQAIAQEKLGGLDLQPVAFADLELPLSDLKPPMLNDLDRLQPTGYGNPEAVFVSRGLRVVQSRPVGKEGLHLKMKVSDGWITYDAIAFRQGHWHAQLPAQVDLLYTFERNYYQGRMDFQLNVRDIRPSGE